MKEEQNEEEKTDEEKKEGEEEGEPEIERETTEVCTKRTFKHVCTKRDVLKKSLYKKEHLKKEQWIWV